MNIKIDIAYLFKVMPQTIALILILLTAACSGDDPKPNELEEAKRKLTSVTWNVKVVTVDGVDKTSMYDGLTLKFTSASFVSSGGKPVWPSSGTWLFKDDAGTLIDRGDGVQLNINELTDDKLSLSLDWNSTTFGGG